MGLFSRKKKIQQKEDNRDKLDDKLRADISKAYDEIISGDAEKKEEEKAEPTKSNRQGSFEAELLKAKIRTFKDKKTQEALVDVLNSLAGKMFLVPSVSNMKAPFEKDGNNLKLKKGAVLTPALLSTTDKKTYLPIFTDEKSMTQKSPSGINLQMVFEQCVGIVYNKKNPVTAIVINPFTENFIMDENLLMNVFKKN